VGYKSEREEKKLDDLLLKYQSLGIVVWGEVEGAPGTHTKVLVKSDGTVKVEGVMTISGMVDVSDRWARQVGQVDIARYLGSAIGVANALHAQIVYGGAVIDPRSIRALVKTTDEIYSVLRTDAGVAYDARDRNWTITEALARSWNLGASDVPDLSDRAARLLGKVYGNQDVLQQRATTKELYVQISHQGVEKDPTQIRALVKTTDEVYSVLRTDAGVAYDARQIRALTSSDIVDISDEPTRQLGLVYGSQNQILQQKATTYELLVDAVDRAARLVGIVYGSLDQLQQRATSKDLLVAIRQGGSELSTSNPLFAGIVDALGNRMPSMDTSTRPGYVDVIDRAARLCGIVYGSQSQQLLQRASTYDLLVAIRQAGSELSATNPIFSSITDVTKVVPPTYLAPTALGVGETATIVSAPGSGYKLRLKGIQISVDAATRIDLRWGTTAWRSYYLPASGTIERNFIAENIEGGNNQALTLLSSAAATVTASASTETLAV